MRQKRSAKDEQVSAEGGSGGVKFDGMVGLMARAAAIGAIAFLVGIQLSGRIW